MRLLILIGIYSLSLSIPLPFATEGAQAGCAKAFVVAARERSTILLGMMGLPPLQLTVPKKIERAQGSPLTRAERNYLRPHLSSKRDAIVVEALNSEREVLASVSLDEKPSSRTRRLGEAVRSLYVKLDEMFPNARDHTIETIYISRTRKRQPYLTAYDLYQLLMVQLHLNSRSVSEKITLSTSILTGSPRDPKKKGFVIPAGSLDFWRADYSTGSLKKDWVIRTRVSPGKEEGLDHFYDPMWDTP